ncbi:MAG: ribosome maturation factor RimM, partial [Turicibacter sp.]|nr:ribosome maturation factor RimM [Turicibacter sp.]
MDFLQVGKIVNTHALQGEVKVVSNSDFKEDRFKKGSTLVIDFNGEYVEVVV